MGLSSLSASKAKFFLRRHSRRVMRSKKLQRYGIFTALLLVVILWRRSDASPVSLRRRSLKELAGGKNEKSFPSTPPPLNTSRSDNESSQAGPTPNTTLASKSCWLKNLTVCLHYDSNATYETFLSVQNGGDIPLTVNITLLPAKEMIPLVELPEIQRKTVKVPDKLGAITSILLSTGDWECEIDVVSEKKKTHVGGVLLFISGVMILAAALAYWKSRAATRRTDGISCERLEMGMANTNSTGGKTSETAEGGWGQSWGDDGWDEVKVVKSPSRVQKGKCLVNGVKDD